MKSVVLFLILSTSDGGVQYREVARYVTEAQCIEAGELKLEQEYFVTGYICSGERVTATFKD